jgi:hypothetical protein
MWRSCVAAVHLDNVVTPEERQWVEEKIKKLPLTEEQRATLRSDLEDGTNFEEAFKKISDKKDLAFLLNTLRVISFLDKDFSEIEKKNFNNLEAIVLKGLNLKAITAEVEAIREQSFSKDEIYKDYNSSSKFEHVFHAFMKFIK